jgi:hypothetical protein
MYELVLKSLQIIYFLFIIIIIVFYYYYYYYLLFFSLVIVVVVTGLNYIVLKNNYIKINTDEFWSAFPHLQTSAFEEIFRIVLSERNSFN